MSQSRRMPLSELIPAWRDLSGERRAEIESQINQEWWLGYDAGREAEKIEGRPDPIPIIARAVESVCSDGNADAARVALDVVRLLEREGFEIKAIEASARR